MTRASIRSIIGIVSVAVLITVSDRRRLAPGNAGERLSEALLRRPLVFEPNRGQADPRAEFLARGHDYSVFLTSDRILLAFRTPEGRRAGVGIRLVGAGTGVTAVGLEELPGRSHYFKGRDPAGWRTGIPQFRKVSSRGIYPGIDLVLYGTHSRLEYDFVLAPGAVPDQVGVEIEGAEKVSLDEKGDLIISASGVQIVHRIPRIYQEAGGIRREVSGRYLLQDRNRVCFAAGPYDQTLPLIIDPEVSFSTYLGGSFQDAGHAVAVDANGYVYVTGETESDDFPLANAAQPYWVGYFDAFVTKLTPDGTGLVYSTFLGGEEDDVGHGIAVGADGHAYVAGSTSSYVFPTTPGAFQPRRIGNIDAFVTRLDASGAMVYSSYLGGTNDDVAFGVGVSGSGAAYVTGRTLSTNFPTRNPYQALLAGDFDVFFTVFNAAGSDLSYSTYLGGTSWEQPFDIALDANGKAYITGTTTSANFPTTPGAAQRVFGGITDAFVAKLDPSNSTLAFSTFLGGRLDDGDLLWYHLGIAVDALERAYVAGTTRSTDFPTTADAFQRAFGGGYTDAYVAKLDTVGGQLMYSTYLGGSQDEQGLDLALAPGGEAWITGRTSSRNFPLANPLRPVCQGCPLEGEAFLAKLRADGSALGHSTYLGGGSYTDSGYSIAASPTGVYIAGRTLATDFPTTPGVIQSVSMGHDAFVMRIVPQVCTGNCLRSETLQLFPWRFGDTPVFIGRVTVKEETGAAVAGATVSVRWTMPGAIRDQDQLTSPDGTATFWIVARNGLTNLRIKNISKSGFAFDPDSSALSKSIRR